jgi:hypothetical protein
MAIWLILLFYIIEHNGVEIIKVKCITSTLLLTWKD